MPIRDIFNPSTQAVETADIVIDDNNDVIATFPNGHFLKFPADLPVQDLTKAIDDVQTHNEGQEVITEEVIAQQQADIQQQQDIIGQITQDGSQQTNDPQAEATN